MNCTKLKLYRNLVIKTTNQGFTLIELLVVIIILGVLSSVALPSLLNQVGKAREVEAKETLSSIGVSQQAYFFQKGNFADRLEKLDIVVNGQEYNYPQPSIHSSGSATQVIHEADAINPINKNKRDYAMGIIYDSGSFEVILCQSNEPGDDALPSTTTIGTCDQGQRIQ
ncbi:MAG: prepilin-type N-terminal cleavage/methylation domain-containing protein [Cyanobacteria bacterium]|jgi:type IV pilus assembly protein PilA|nr:prepilin-type N-terminal cleavage/methylation domain-containing protein [Cyanobacteria bacterium GSL.Bin1]